MPDTFDLERWYGPTATLSAAELQLIGASQLEVLNLTIRADADGPRIARYVDSETGLRLLRHGKELLNNGEYGSLPCLALALRYLLHDAGAEAFDTLAALQQLGLAYRLTGDYSTAEALLADVLRRHELRSTPRDEYLVVLNDHAVLLLDLDRPEEAKQRLESAMAEAVQLAGAAGALTLMLQANLADAYRVLGDLRRCYEIEKAVLSARCELLGEEHPDTLISYNNIAYTLQLQGRVREARDIQEQLLQKRTRVLGPEHPDTITSMGNLAVSHGKLDEPLRAYDLEMQVVNLRTQHSGADHPDTLLAKNNLSETLRDIGDVSAAREMLEEIIEPLRKQLGDMHEATLRAENNLAVLLRQLHELVRARDLAERVYQVRNCVRGPLHRDTLAALENLVAIDFEEGGHRGAVEQQREVIEAYGDLLGASHPLTLAAEHDLARWLGQLGDYTAAAALFRKVVEGRTQVLGNDHSDTLLTLLGNAEVLLMQMDTTAAQSAVREVAERLQARTMVLGHDYDVMARAAALAVSLDLRDLLETFFPMGSTKLRVAIELQKWESARALFKAFQRFHYSWLMLCTRHDIDSISLAIAPLHGLEAAGVVDVNRKSPVPSPARDRYLGARQQLADARMDLEQLHAALMQARTDLATTVADDPKRPRMELRVAQQERAWQDGSKLEHAALTQYEAVAAELTRVDPEFAAVFRGTAQRASQLRAALANSEALVLIMKLPDDTGAALVITAQTTEVISIPQVTALRDQWRERARRYGETARGLLRDHLPSEELPAGAESGEPGTDDLHAKFDPVDRTRKIFWHSLSAMLPTIECVHLVSCPELHDFPLPGEPSGLEVFRYLGLPAYFRLQSAKVAVTPVGAMQLCLIADAAWSTLRPIPFAEVDTAVAATLTGAATRVAGNVALQAFEQGSLAPQVMIACHGAEAGDQQRRYSVLVFDWQQHANLDPSALRRAPHRFVEFYCSSCVGGLVSHTIGGDALGIVGTLQLQGVPAVIASIAPVPDFYMPLLAALYWEARCRNRSPHRALAAAKQKLGDGDWPHVVVDAVRTQYSAQMLRVLELSRFDSNMSLLAQRQARELAHTVLGWHLPERLFAESYFRNRLRSFDDYATFSDVWCSTASRRAELASLAVDSLIDGRATLPAHAVDRICSYIFCFGVSMPIAQ